MPRKVKGIRRHGAGFETYVRVNGQFRSRSWAPDTPIAEMTAWLKAHRGIRLRPSRDSFTYDAQLYLTHVTALATYKQRVAHLELWCAVFGAKRRASISSAEIRAQRDRWLLKGLAPHTVNLRLRALSNLWTVLDGRRAPNPVRDVPEAVEPDPEPRSIPYPLVLDVLRGFLLRETLEYAQAELMAVLGLAPVEIERLMPRGWNATMATLFVQGRQKGQGGNSRMIHLEARGTAALEHFDNASGWGKTIGRKFRRTFRRACHRVAADPKLSLAMKTRLRRLTPYDFRHSYATALYRSSGDAHATAHILGHRSKQTTARYIQSALEERVQKAVQSVEALVGSGAK